VRGLKGSAKFCPKNRAVLPRSGTFNRGAEDPPPSTTHRTGLVRSPFGVQVVPQMLLAWRRTHNKFPVSSRLSLVPENIPLESRERPARGPRPHCPNGSASGHVCLYGACHSNLFSPKIWMAKGIGTERPQRRVFEDSIWRLRNTLAGRCPG